MRFGGGGGNTRLNLVVKTVDETIDSDIVLHNDLELFFPVQANRFYCGNFDFIYNSPAVPDLDYTLVAPAGSSLDEFFSYAGSTNSAIAFGAESFQAGTGANRNSPQHYFKFLVGGTAGNMNFQWAQNVSDGADSSVLRGSKIIWMEV